MEKVENNVVELSGTVVSEELTFSHEIYGEKFYIFELAVNRLSEEKDVIPIMISENSLMFSKIKENIYLYIEGRYRSYNQHKDNRNKLILTVFAKDIWIINPEEKDINRVTLQGYICKPVIYRKTPLGREIADIMLAINRSYGKSDYIPCIAWGKKAREATDLQVGDKIIAYGRIQSRIYLKKISEEKSEEKTAYEVSIAKLELVN